MKKYLLSLLLAGSAVITLSACTPTQVGTATGAAAGAGIGYAVSGGDALGTAIGAGAGALIGNQIGQSQERRYYRNGRYYYY
ncbi:glycine zipper domain-containing protein [Legionella oakridgensis]|uniref:Surface antigen n=2 Tax=Legionella oakridgensis TaxID=29423 RepID=W0BGJ5_9GAMM|nr:glycine zipper domain-containing protein [Legionella oakridgensis]AHE67806.1 surface antigen [Legionella oakridgensis ATCC 33761 = DSM 21215]ETO92610.1 glycine zipper [Legionella oakridgensis RV-2-2007]KTD44052.1 Glycine zipper 2TM domain protein [Legionella oakridgensis]STY20820.1 Surface antigen [Legionella longbeachae]